MKKSRREFPKLSATATMGIYAGAIGFSARSYGNIVGANKGVNVGVVWL